MKPNIPILLFGFSGSGKSTMAEMLGKKLKLRIVHPSSLLREMLEDKQPNVAKTRAGTGFWERKKGINLLKDRLNKKKPIDLEVDKLLIAELQKGNLVMDSWNMAWLFKGQAIRIYLKASQKKRIARVSKRSRISKVQAEKTIQAKDGDTRKLFKRLYGIDIAKDHQIFNYTINTSNLSKKQIFKKLLELIVP